MVKIKKLLRPIYVPIMHLIHQIFFGPKRYQNLFREIKDKKAKKILEIGTWSGDRAVAMIRVAQKNFPSEAVSYVGFDLFEDLTQELYIQEISKKPPRMQDVEVKLISTGADIKLFKGDTKITLTEFANTDYKADFIFIDGGHDIETVTSDWENCRKLMHKDSVVIFDDYWRNNPTQSAKPVVDSIDRSLYKVEILPEIDTFSNPDFGRLEISFAKVTRI